MSDQHWAGVDQRHMAALAAVAEHGSFRAAAESLGYVQSAVSDQISHLERSAGLSLVERRRGVASGQLTEAGRLLLRRFQTIAGELAAAREEMAALNGEGSGPLRVGACASLGEWLLPGVLADLRRIHPEVTVEVVGCASEAELARRLAAGELLAGLGALPPQEGPLRRRELSQDPWVLLTPADWPMSRSTRPPTLSQLAGLPLIGTADSPASRLLEAELVAAGVEPHYVLRSDLDGVVREGVAAGLGAAIVPWTTVDHADPRTVALELDPRLSHRTIVIAWRQDRGGTPGLGRLVELAAVRAEKLSARPSARADVA
jgi:molybdate transport repressor ModE-like protein